MDDAFLSLSWSAVLAGWPTMFLSVADVRDLAEARLLTASDTALVPMSDLVCLTADADRQEAQDALTRLAALENLPPFFVQREWQVYMLAWELDQLPAINDEEEPGLTSYWQMQALERWWEVNDQPIDLPVLNPLIQSYGGLNEEPGGIQLTVDDLRGWIKEQRTLLQVLAGLIQSGRHQDVRVIAQAFEAAQVNAAAHLDVVRKELSIYQHWATGGPRATFWKKITEANAATLRDRRVRGQQRRPE